MVCQTLSARLLISQEKNNKMAKEIQLEIEVETCRHLEVDVKRERLPVIINLGNEDNRKIGIDSVFDMVPDEVICDITKKPCVLHRINLNRQYIYFSERERCPLFETKFVVYSINGRIERQNHISPSIFYAERIKKAE